MQRQQNTHRPPRKEPRTTDRQQPTTNLNPQNIMSESVSSRTRLNLHRTGRLPLENEAAPPIPEGEEYGSSVEGVVLDFNSVVDDSSTGNSIGDDSDNITNEGNAERFVGWTSDG